MGRLRTSDNGEIIFMSARILSGNELFSGKNQKDPFKKTNRNITHDVLPLDPVKS